MKTSNVEFSAFHKDNYHFLNLLEETEIEQNLTVIAYSENSGCILAQDKKTSKAHYIYLISEGHCDYSLFCEVGQPLKPAFQKLLNNNNLVPVSVETDSDYYEIFQSK